MQGGQGDYGPAGPSGPTGAAGPKGDVGERGPEGDTVICKSHSLSKQSITPLQPDRALRARLGPADRRVPPDRRGREAAPRRCPERRASPASPATSDRTATLEPRVPWALEDQSATQPRLRRPSAVPTAAERCSRCRREWSSSFRCSRLLLMSLPSAERPNQYQRRCLGQLLPEQCQ